MQAIASLLQDDPWLRMPRDERIALRRDIRQKFRSVPPRQPCATQLTFYIPNTPYGAPERTQVKPWAPVLSEKDYWPGLWCWDLVNGVPRDPEPVSVDRIMRAATAFYGFSKIDLCSPRRQATLVRARQIAMYLAKMLTLRSLPSIGRHFGNRDHTTVLHAVRKIARLLRTDAALAAEICTLKQWIAA